MTADVDHPGPADRDPVTRDQDQRPGTGRTQRRFDGDGRRGEHAERAVGGIRGHAVRHGIDRRPRPRDPQRQAGCRREADAEWLGAKAHGCVGASAPCVGASVAAGPAAGFAEALRTAGRVRRTDGVARVARRRRRERGRRVVAACGEQARDEDGGDQQDADADLVLVTGDVLHDAMVAACGSV